MKKIVFFLLFTFAGFASDFVLDNQTSYPNAEAKSQIAIQWASSAKEVDEDNKALMDKTPVNKGSLQFLSQSGKITIQVPDAKQYFRMLAWSQEEILPDLSTNWIEVEANKTYTLTQDHLVPIVLMLGTGC